MGLERTLAAQQDLFEASARVRVGSFGQPRLPQPLDCAASGNRCTRGSPGHSRRSSRTSPATQPEVPAHHFTEADLTENAITYWRKAGQRSAHAEAIAHLRKGLMLVERATDPAERAQPPHRLAPQPV
jgi:hypothetical protein